MAFGALSSGISALRSFSKGMEVIGNNIANVNTVAFKGQRIKYAETFNQLLQQSAPSPSDGRGSNVQASQVGLGVQVQGIVGQFEQGGLSATAQPTDLAITEGEIVEWNGSGWFVVAAEPEALLLRPEQPADMWCQEGNPPAIIPTEPQRFTRADLADSRGHLLLRPKYPKGC